MLEASATLSSSGSSEHALHKMELVGMIRLHASCSVSHGRLMRIAILLLDEGCRGSQL